MNKVLPGKIFSDKCQYKSCHPGKYSQQMRMNFHIISNSSPLDCMIRINFYLNKVNEGVGINF